nr:uncharacterized protein LOC123756104 [Procambarus clarkii]
MEDEYDLEVEIERQLAQEEEEMAEMQENIANQKLAQQTAKDVNETVIAKFNSSKYFHKPLNKMSSLPSNFTFRGQREVMETSSRDKASPLTPVLPDIRVETSLNIPRININGRGYEVESEASASHLPPFTHEEDLYNPNLKHPSPDEPVDKVSITDLRQKRPSPNCGRAQTTSSTPTQQHEATENSQKVQNEAPLAGSFEGDDDLSGTDSLIPGPNSPLLQERDNPSTQQAVRQSPWCNRREFSSGGGRKVSLDDSLTQTLMASFDNVPELGGRLDMDSTSCSVCSSEEMSVASRLSSGPSPQATITSGPSTAKDNTQILSPHPQAVSTSQVFAAADDDDDDATLASSSDSFTLEGGPPEVLSLDSSPGSDGISGPSATIIPHSSSPSPILSSPVSEPANVSFKHPLNPSNCSSDSTDSPSSSYASPILSAPIAFQGASSLSELANSVQPFSSLCELRTEAFTHSSTQSPATQCRDIQHYQAENNQPLSPKPNFKQPGPKSEGSQFWPSQPWLLQPEGNELWPSRPEQHQSQPSSTIGLQLGDNRPQSKAYKLHAGQRCYIRSRNKTRYSGPES